VARRPRGSAKHRRPKGNTLARLKPEEGAGILRTILDRHPELVAEAEEIARAVVADVEAEAVAEDVERAVLDLDLGELNSRAGRLEWGYVEPAEAAWEILAEAIGPFLEDMKRHVDLGFEAAAVGTCAGIVLGLYRCRGKNPDQVLGWAEDFPADAAGDAVAMLAGESRAKHRRAWRLPDGVVAQIPEWVEMIGRCSSPSSGRR
jgi:hypothetical protein